MANIPDLFAEEQEAPQAEGIPDLFADEAPKGFQPASYEQVERPIEFNPLAEDKAVPEARGELSDNPLPGMLYKGLHFLDRGRSAAVGFVTEFIREGENSAKVLHNSNASLPEKVSLYGPMLADIVNKASTKFMAGIKGEEHPLLGDFIFELTQEARAKPEERPILSAIQDLISRAKWTGQEWSVNDEGKVQLAMVQKGFEPAEADALISTMFGISGDIALDPLTYTGTQVTKLGQVSRAQTSLAREGMPISWNSELGQLRNQIKAKGQKIDPYGRTFTERLKLGQEQIVLGGVPLPKVVAVPLAENFGKVTKALAETPIGHSTRYIFSTKYGLPEGTEEFVRMEEKFNNLMAVAREKTVKENAAFKQEVNDLAKELTEATGEKVHPQLLGRFITNATEIITKDSGWAFQPQALNGQVRHGVVKSFFARNPYLAQKLNPKELSPSAIEYVSKDEKVRKLITSLRAKNDQQLAEEMKTIGTASLADTPARRVKLLEDSAKKYLTSDQKNPLHPFTGKRTTMENLRQEIDLAKEEMIEAEKINYFIHAATPEFKRIIQKHSKKTGGEGAPFVYAKKHASTLHRDFRHMTIEEINTLAKEGKLPGYEGIKINQAFYDDPAIAQALRDMRHKKAMITYDFIEKAKSEFGIPVRDLGDNYIPEGWAVGTNPLTRNYAFPKGIAQRLDETFKTVLDPKEAGAFRHYYDMSLNWYKAWTLSPFPAYHTRNIASNLFNNWVTGTRNPIVYKLARDVQMGKQGFIRTKDGRQIAYDEIRRHMDELGIRNKGLMAIDIDLSVQNEVKGGKWMTLGTNSKLIHKGKEVGEAIENNSRLGKFIDELRKGSGFQDAADATKHALFDYTDLTHVEKGAFKRLMPFYTWSRKNIPLQVEMMLKRPGIYQGIDTIREEIEARTQDPSEQLLANWMLELYPARVKVGEDGLPRYFLAGSWLPAGDVWRIAASPQNLITDLLSPFIKTPIELTMNYDFYRETEIQKYDNEQVTYMGEFRVSPKTKKLLDTIRLLNTLDDMIPKERKMTDMRRDPPKTPEETLIEFLTGVKIYTQDLEIQRQFRVMEAQQEITDESQYLKELIVERASTKNPKLQKKIDQEIQDQTRYLSEEKTKKALKVMER